MKPAGLNILDVYPNPFNNRALIRFSLPYDGPYTMTIFNVQGTQIASQTFYHYASDEFISFELSSLMPESAASGLYFIQLSQLKQSAVHKALYIK